LRKLAFSNSGIEDNIGDDFLRLIHTQRVCEPSGRLGTGACAFADNTDKTIVIACRTLRTPSSPKLHGESSARPMGFWQTLPKLAFADIFETWV
jgi:hypothetical protein